LTSPHLGQALAVRATGAPQDTHFAIICRLDPCRWLSAKPDPRRRGVYAIRGRPRGVSDAFCPRSVIAMRCE
jgi:hypothetical protein